LIIVFMLLPSHIRVGPLSLPYNALASLRRRWSR
jgi:hypothetical protein